jgi:hypothetical protein
VAVDTRNKRASAIQPGLLSFRIWPNPDGSLATIADRVHMGWLYAGITPSAVVAATVLGSISLSAERESLSLSAEREALTLEAEMEELSLSGDLN